MADEREDDGQGWAPVAVIGAVVGFVAYHFGGKAIERWRRGGGTGDLTPRRAKALEAIAQVVPSKYGDGRWEDIAPGFDPANPPSANFTTCGFLPLAIGKKIGINTRGGLASIREIGEKVGAWVPFDGTRRPKPGDFYLIGDDQGAILHTGIIYSGQEGTQWVTADAGQGTRLAPEAAFVTRTFDPVAGTLSTTSPIHPKAKLLGWLDLDKFPAGAKV